MDLTALTLEEAQPQDHAPQDHAPQDDQTPQEVALSAQLAKLEAELAAAPTIQRLQDERENLGRRIAHTECRLRNASWKGAEPANRAELQKELRVMKELGVSKYGPDEDYKCYSERQELVWKIRDVQRELKVWKNARMGNITYEEAEAAQKVRDKAEADEKERERVAKARAFIDEWLGRPATNYSIEEGSEAWENWYAKLRCQYIE